MTVVVRPDLSARTALSKSALGELEMCGAKAWFALHDRRPAIPNERMTFGSAVDAGVEQVIAAMRSQYPLEEERVLAAILEVAGRDGVEIEIEDALTACMEFAVVVAPRYDLSLAVTQREYRTVLEGLGECEGHPDVVIRNPDGSVDIYDVKTSSRRKDEDAAVLSVELGFYTLLLEDSGERVRRVGYWTWVRAKSKPGWQVVDAPATEALRRRTWAVARAYARARKADEVLNAKAATPRNFSFPSGPKNHGLCVGCQYNPSAGGPCELAATTAEEVA